MADGSIFAARGPVESAPFGSTRKGGGDPGEAAFVRGHRLNGTSWFDLGRMTGRNVLDLRRDYDPDFPADAYPGRRATEVPEPPAPRRKLGPAQAAAIEAVRFGPKTTAEVARSIERSPLQTAQVMETLVVAGLVEAVPAAAAGEALTWRRAK